jgi:hypothetical protein
MENKVKLVQADETPSKGIKVSRVLMHQAFTIGGATETSLYEHKGFNLFYTSDGLVGDYKGLRFIVPLANVIVAYI